MISSRIIFVYFNNMGLEYKFSLNSLHGVLNYIPFTCLLLTSHIIKDKNTDYHMNHHNHDQ